MSKDLKGQTFGEWTVVYDPGDGVMRKVTARCSCGIERSVLARNLIKGLTTWCNRPSRHPERTK